MRPIRLSMLLAIALTSLVACGDKGDEDEDDDDDGDDTAADDTGGGDDSGSAGGLDLDGDGYGRDEDCNDSNPDIHPGATEICDDYDNDCDGLTDDDDDSLDPTSAQLFFADADNDGYGDPENPVYACIQPASTSTDDTDCDDSSRFVNPGASEDCDGVDNDCDGLADDDDPDVDLSTTRDWYADGDGDGDGDPTDSVEACAPPAGRSLTGTDCDDTDSTVYSGATELCDGLDNDCDGRVPIDEQDGDGDDHVTCTVDGGGWDGVSISGGGDCDDTDDTVHPSAAELCDGQDNDCDGSLSSGESDADGDGYITCTVDGGGWDGSGTPTEGDCDDSNSAVNPGATEVCDSADTDEDCDGRADDADSSVSSSGYSTWYEDADGDGFGSASAATRDACDAAAPYTATTNTDCDDDDANSYPGATEICDGNDNDCDSDTTDEDGLATFTDASGTLTDWTSTMTGTGSSPAAVSLTSAGTLAVCDGRWYVSLDAQADVDIVNPDGVRNNVVLDANRTGPVLTVSTAAVAVSVTDLVIKNGDNTAGGGNIDCTGAAATLDLVGVDVTDGTGTDGGGISADQCSVSLDDVVVEDNEATDGGGIWLADADLVVTNSEIIDNIATGDGAGLHVSGTGSTIVSVDLDEVDVSGNVASSAGGGAFIADANGTVDFMATGTAATTAGFFDNSATEGGGIYIEGESDVAGLEVDMGTSAGGDDNSPDDVVADASGTTIDDLGDDDTFLCAAGTCITGAASTHTHSGSAVTADGNDSTRANVFLADGDGWIRGMGFYLTPDSTCTVDFYVMSNSTFTTSGWTVEHATTDIPDAGAGWYESDPMLVEVTTGTYYAFVMGFDCSSGDRVEYYYNRTDDGSDDISGFLSRQGGAGHNTTYTAPWAEGDSVTFAYAGTFEPARYYATIDYTQ